MKIDIDNGIISFEDEEEKCRAVIRWKVDNNRFNIEAKLFDDLINKHIAEFNLLVLKVDAASLEEILRKFEESVVSNLVRNDPRNKIYIETVDNLKEEVRRLVL